MILLLTFMKCPSYFDACYPEAKILDIEIAISKCIIRKLIQEKHNIRNVLFVNFCLDVNILFRPYVNYACWSAS